MKKLFATYQFRDSVTGESGTDSTLLDYDDTNVSEYLLSDIKAIAKKRYRLSSYVPVVITSIVILGESAPRDMDNE